MMQQMTAESKYIAELKEEVGEDLAGKIIVAQKYIDGMEEISDNPSNKVFLPNNFNGVFALGNKK